MSWEKIHSIIPSTSAELFAWLVIVGSLGVGLRYWIDNS